MNLSQLQHVSISELLPSLDPSNAYVRGIVTLVWPYSSLTQSMSLLLVEPDFRLRLKKGQVRIKFLGLCARHVAGAKVSSGDEIVLKLDGSNWAEEGDDSVATPGRSAGWEVSFGQHVSLEIRREKLEPVVINVDKDSPTPEPDRRASSFNPTAKSPTSIQRSFLNGSNGPYEDAKLTWSSPSILKRKATSTIAAYDPFIDPFGQQEYFQDLRPNKRSKTGRLSGLWRVVDRSPNPSSSPSPTRERPLMVVAPTPEHHTRAARELTAAPLERYQDSDSVKAFKAAADAADEAIDLNSPTDVATEVTSDAATDISHYLEAVPQSELNLGTEAQTIAQDVAPPLQAMEEPGPVETMEELFASEDVIEKQPNVSHLDEEPASLTIDIRAATPLPDDVQLQSHLQHPTTPRLSALPSPGLPTVSPLTMKKPPSVLTNENPDGAISRKQEIDSKLDTKDTESQLMASDNTPTIERSKSTEHQMEVDGPIIRSPNMSEVLPGPFIPQMPDNNVEDASVGLEAENEDEIASEPVPDEQEKELAKQPAAWDHVTELADLAEETHDGGDEQRQSAQTRSWPANVAFDEPDLSTAKPEQNTDMLHMLERVAPEDHSDALAAVAGREILSSEGHEVDTASEATDVLEEGIVAEYTQTQLMRATFGSQMGVDLADETVPEKPSFASSIDKIEALSEEEKAEESDEMEVEEAPLEDPSTLAQAELEVALEEEILTTTTGPQIPATKVESIAKKRGEDRNVSVHEENVEELQAKAASPELVEPSPFASQVIAHGTDHELPTRNNVPFQSQASPKEIAAETGQKNQLATPDVTQPRSPVRQVSDMRLQTEPDGKATLEPMTPLQSQAQEPTELMGPQDSPQRIEQPKEFVSSGKPEELVASFSTSRPGFADDRAQFEATQEAQEPQVVPAPELQTEQGTLELDTKTEGGEAEEESPLDWRMEQANRNVSEGIERDDQDEVNSPPRARSLEIDEPDVGKSHEAPEAVGQEESQLEPEKSIPFDERIEQLRKRVSRRLEEPAQQDTSSTSQARAPAFPGPGDRLEGQEAVDIYADGEDQDSIEANLPFDERVEQLRRRASQNTQSKDRGEPVETQRIHSPELEEINQQARIQEEPVTASSPADQLRSELRSSLTSRSRPEFLAELQQNESTEKRMPVAEPGLVAEDESVRSLGFRTSISYYTPLSLLHDHYNAKVDVLAIVLATTPIERAKSGPRDYFTTVYLLDYSSVPFVSESSSTEPFFTSAQTFRGIKRALPLAKTGDVVLLRQFKVIQPPAKNGDGPRRDKDGREGRLGLISTNSSSWAVFGQDEEIAMRGAHVELGHEEMRFARGLKKWFLGMDADTKDALAKRLPHDAKYTEPEQTALQPETQEPEPERVREERAPEGGEPKPATRQSRSSRKRQLLAEESNEHEPRGGAHYRGETPTRPSNRGTRAIAEASHELRDGTTYVDDTPSKRQPRSTRKMRASIHELRDGTTYVDEPMATPPRRQTQQPREAPRESPDPAAPDGGTPTPAAARSTRSSPQQPNDATHELRDGTVYDDAPSSEKQRAARTKGLKHELRSGRKYQ